MTRDEAECKIREVKWAIARGLAWYMLSFAILGAVYWWDALVPAPLALLCGMVVVWCWKQADL
jgi:hypothetical protein